MSVAESTPQAGALPHDQPAVAVSRLISPGDRRRRDVRIALPSVHAIVMVGLVIAGLGPILWMVKSAVSPAAEIGSHPLGVWPDVTRWSNIKTAVTGLHIGRALINSVYLAVGSLLAQMLVSTTAAYALAVIRPRYRAIVNGAILATLLVPGTVVLIPLYLTILDVPGLGVSLADSNWAIWLLAGVNAFNVLLLTRYFEGIPRELLEAARVDGAGVFGVFWRIVLPLSRPVLAVVAVLTATASWKDYLWPLIIFSSPDKQPVSVALPRIAQSSDQGLVVAGLLMASIPPFIFFALFQKQIINGVGGDTGSKG